MKICCASKFEGNMRKKCRRKGATGKIDIVMVDLMEIMKSLKVQSYLMIEIYLKYIC